MYITLDDVFTTLNEAGVNYLVMRNFEDFDSNSFLSNHPDIDFLCDDRERFISVLSSKPRETNNDKIHQKIIVDGKEVAIDIRVIGDGYYDTPWERQMLEHKQDYHSFYIPNSEDYYYSLLYHALIHKWKIDNDYLSRLKKMNDTIEIKDRTTSLAALERYMRKKGFCYTIPEFSGAIYNIKGTDRQLIKSNLARLVKRFLHNL